MAEDELFEAFLAGFEASTEGFNGEWVGERFRGRDGVSAPAFIERMREKFDLWIAKEPAEAGSRTTDQPDD